MVQNARTSFAWGWIVLIVTFLGHGIVMGILTYAQPVIFPAMVTANGWSRGDASAPLSIAAWVGLAAYPLAGTAVGKFGARRVVSAGALGIGVIWLLLTQITELWQWYVLHIIGWGIIVPFASTAVFMSIVVQWFNLRRGIAVGTVFVGYSAIGFFLGPISQSMMTATKSWQMGWGIMGAAMVVAGLLCTFLIRSKPGDVGTYPDGLTPEEALRKREEALSGRGGVTGVARTFRAPKDRTLGEAIRTRQFWCIGSVYAGFAGGAFAFSQAGFIGASKGIPLPDIAFAFSLSALAALPWRFLSGWLADRIEARWCLFVGQILTAIALMFLWTVPQGNTWWLWTWAILNGTGSAGLSNTLLSVITSNYFGARYFATIFASGMMPIFGLIVGLGPGAAGYIFQFNGNYDLAFILFIGILAIAAAAQLVNSPPKIKDTAAQAAAVS